MVLKISFTAPYSSPDRQLADHITSSQIKSEHLKLRCLSPSVPSDPGDGNSKGDSARCPPSSGEAVRVPDAAPWGETGCRCVLYRFLLPPRQTVLSWSSGTVRRKSKEKVGSQCLHVHQGSCVLSQAWQHSYQH